LQKQTESRQGTICFDCIGLLSIGNRYIVTSVTNNSTRSALLGKNPGVPALILSSLAGGEKHGYALVKDVAEFAGVDLAPGTLYEALARLERLGLIEAIATDDRRRPYRLTGAGATALSEYLATQQQVVKVGQSRLSRGWSFS
jgi:DNA-binding PadR family transcriptional regulator